VLSDFAVVFDKFTFMLATEIIYGRLSLQYFIWTLQKQAYFPDLLGFWFI
jgi:hypothetical protein